MIKTPTLFVLGAGASKPYNFPLGFELRRLICRAQAAGDSGTAALESELKYKRSDIVRIAGEFARSNVRSIDEFLGRHQDFEKVGKALIAFHLCRQENRVTLWNDLIEDHWYRHLWNALIDDATKVHEIANNNVRFLTFNYDRSLECFLHESTKSTYGVTDDVAHDAWSHMKVRHIYGMLGEFTYENKVHDLARPYLPEINADTLRVASAGISIMPETRTDAPIFAQAREWFAWASRIYFLGFAFDRLNCERLCVPDALRPKKGLKMPVITASALTLTAAEITRAERFLLGDPKVWQWKPYNEKSTMTLREAGLPD